MPGDQLKKLELHLYSKIDESGQLDESKDDFKPL